MSVRRPFGLTLAIIMAIMLFGIWPLMKLYFAWDLSSGVNDSGFAWGNDTFAFDTANKVVGLLGAAVIVSAIFAWYGKPPQVRFVFQALVLITGIALIIETAMRAAPGDVFADSASAALADVLRCQVPIQILTALYIIWYCNRAPARAFYRQEPLRSWQESNQGVSSL